MRINESILDDYTPEEELSSVKKLTVDTISEDELLYPAISDFQVVLKLPVPDDVFSGTLTPSFSTYNVIVSLIWVDNALN